jgi:hypothetical protein
MQKNNMTEPTRIPVVLLPYAEREPMLHAVAQQLTEHIQRQGRFSQQEQEHIVTLLTCLRRRQPLPVSTVETLLADVKRKQGMTLVIEELYKDVVRELKFISRTLQEEWFLQAFQSRSSLPHASGMPTQQDSGGQWQEKILQLCPRGAGISQIELVIRVRRRLNIPSQEAIRCINDLVAQRQLSKDPCTLWLKRVKTYIHA